MPRTKWWLLCCLLLYLVELCTSDGRGQSQCERPTGNSGKNHIRRCMNYTNDILQKGNMWNNIKVMQEVEDLLENVEVDETMSISFPRVLFYLQKPKTAFTQIDISASETEASSSKIVSNARVNVQLPRELNTGSYSTIAFCLLTWPGTNKVTPGASDELYNNTMVSLYVRRKKISQLRTRVNITMTLDISKNETRVPKCVFYDFTNKNFADYSSSGCLTLWRRGQGHITCSCNHLTYFGVLMVSAPLSAKDQEILTYISQIGCSLSLIALGITVVIFITNRTVREDVSMKIHINLAVALILLNLHFLPSHIVAAGSSTGICIYMALLLHYSLLATFSWMALEGFHIYLLLVKVFNIYIKKYLLKLSLVGWGVPVIIVSLVVIIDRDAYGRVALNSSNPNSTAICYIANNVARMVTTVGVFGLVFIFNVIMFGLTVRRVVSLQHMRECGPSDRAKRDICTLLGVSTLLGITWGLVLFSFGYLAAPGLYLFCILNSLQGVFILLWFVMSLRKNVNSAPVSVTRSTND